MGSVCKVQPLSLLYMSISTIPICMLCMLGAQLAGAVISMVVGAVLMVVGWVYPTDEEEANAQAAGLRVPPRLLLWLLGATPVHFALASPEALHTKGKWSPFHTGRHSR